MKGIYNNENLSIFIVADGHGVQGHIVSQFIISRLPEIILELFEKARDELQFYIKNVLM